MVTRELLRVDLITLQDFHGAQFISYVFLPWYSIITASALLMEAIVVGNYQAVFSGRYFVVVTPGNTHTFSHNGKQMGWLM